jgi:hypothetical protein
LVACLCSLALARATPAQDDAPNLAVTSPPAAAVSVADAIDTAVAFLVANQNNDGSFGSYTAGRDYEIMASVPGSLHAFKAATTALCWMGLYRNPRPTEQSRAAAERALAWLVDKVRVKRANGYEMYNIWAFGFGLQALAEALHDGAPGADEERVRKVCEDLVAAIATYQVPDGGFTYYDFLAQTYHPSDSSMTFCTGTVLIALHGARKAGVAVPQKMIDKAVNSLRASRTKEGSYLYGPYLKYVPRMGINRPKGSSLRTQTCNLALYLFDGGVGLDDMTAGLQQLVDQHRFAIAGVRRPIPHESWYQVSGYFYLYGEMYAAMVLEHLPTDVQERYWPEVVQHTLKCRQTDGSYWDYPMYGFHKFYGTGFALMTFARCPPEIAAGITPAGAPAATPSPSGAVERGERN